jgi:hypothetical protein
MKNGIRHLELTEVFSRFTWNSKDMKRVTLKVPDKKWRFFFELIDHLGIEVAEETDIPKEHKAMVRDRIKTAKDEDMVPRDEARKELTFKGKT